MSRFPARGIHWSARTAGSASVFVVVHEAETGRKLNVELAQGELEIGVIDVIRAKLYRATNVPPENQILLCGGPPYKVLRSQLPPGAVANLTAENETAASATGSTSTTSNANIIGSSSSNAKQKIFLFDWRTLAPERSVPASPTLSGIVPGYTLSGEAESALGLSATVGAAQAAEAVAAEYVGPVEVLLPTQPKAAPSPLPSAEGSVLLATIANYERGSMLALNRGENYADTSAQRLRGGELCVERMQTQIEALSAAVSNSLDHWEPLERSYRTLSAKLEEQAVRHQEMLETFEQDLARLATIPLHPSLATASLNSRTTAVTTAATTTAATPSVGVVSSRTSGSTGGGSHEERRASRRSDAAATASEAGVVGIRVGGAVWHEGTTDIERRTQSAISATLLDCVPVERERRLLESCRTSQRRFRQEAEAVAEKYTAIKNGLEKQREVPVTGNDIVQGHLEKIRELCKEQERRRGELEANYRESFTRATQENWTGDQEKQDAIQRMTELTVTQEKIVPLMKENDLRVMETVAEIARAKAALSVTLRRRLREVSKLQTDIGNIQKHQELVGMAWGQKEEQFEHLGKVAKMPAAYEAFLLEVLRRRRHHQDFESRVTDFCSSMEALRSSEIAAREAFRETHLDNLPPVFIDMAPGLRQAPPVFSPSPATPLYEGDLPEVRPEDVEPPEELARSVASTQAELLTTVAQAPTEQMEVAPAAVEEGAVESLVDAEKSEEASTSATALSGEGELEAGVEEGGEAVQAAKAAGEQSAVGRNSSAILYAENARLLHELADTRGRLEQLEREREEAWQAATAAATAAAAAAAAKVAVPTAATVSVSARPDTTTTASGSDFPPPPSPVLPSVALSSRGDAADTSNDAARVLDQRRKDVLEAENKSCRSLGVAGSNAEVTSADARSACEGSARQFVGVLPAGRGSGARRSSGATQNQVAAYQSQLASYRAGLCMLVKLADQLAAAAASGVGNGVPARGEWGLSPPPTAERAPGVAVSPAAADTSESEDSVPIAPTPVVASAIIPSPDGTESAEVVEQAGSTTDATYSGGIEVAEVIDNDDHAALESATTVNVPGETDGIEETGSGDGNSGTSANTSAEVGEAREGHKGGAGAEVGVQEKESRGREGTGGDESSATEASAQGEADEAEASGLEKTQTKPSGAEEPPSSSSPSSTRRKHEPAGENNKVESGHLSTSVGTDVTDSSTTTTATSATLSGSTSTTRMSERDGSSRGGGEGGQAAARTGKSGGHVETKDAAVTAAVVVARKELPEVVRTGRGGSGGGMADVERIRKAAEYVAGVLRRLHGQVDQLLTESAAVPKISMCSFDVQDIALFLPTMAGPPDASSGIVFMAFHVNCPNRYLSEDSINIVKQNLGSYPVYILGRIITIERHVGSEESNPYNVANKTVYYVLRAQILLH